MRTLLGTLKSLAIAGAVFAIAFAVIFPMLAGEAHRNYVRLVYAWNSPSFTLPEFQKISSDVAIETRDEDVRFVASQLVLLASAASDLGYKRLDEIKTANGFDATRRGLVRGLAMGVELGISLHDSDPVAFSNAAAKMERTFKSSVSLLWNANKLDRTAKMLDARNKRMELLKWTVSAGVALVSFSWIRRTRAVKRYLPAQQTEVVKV